jgi:DNA-binding NtrC family response regulator
MLLCENDKITIDDIPKSTTGQKSLHETRIWPDDLMKQPLKTARKNITEKFEFDYFSNLLNFTKGRVGEAAKKAGIDSRSLYDKMKKYKLNKEDFR